MTNTTARLGSQLDSSHTQGKNTKAEFEVAAAQAEKDWGDTLWPQVLAKPF